jgi:hypothetical protein
MNSARICGERQRWNKYLSGERGIFYPQMKADERRLREPEI